MLLKDFIAGRLRELRARHGLTQEQVAEILGTDVKWYQRIEWSKKDLRASTIDRLSKVFGVDAVEFLAAPMPDTKTPRVPPASHRAKKKTAVKNPENGE